MNTRDLNFLFLSLLMSFSLSLLVSHHKKVLVSLAFFLLSWFLSFVFGKRGGLSPLQRDDDDDDVNENDDWVCKNNDDCFHPDIIVVVIVFVAKKFKDHL